MPRRATPSRGPRPTRSAADGKGLPNSHGIQGRLPAATRGQLTLFQRKVYEAILRIPKGEVRSYAEVARMIGKPRAARAVGQALKRNRWAPQIPCHRVVASDGTLGGYSAPGGLRTKRHLLQREGADLSK